MKSIIKTGLTSLMRLVPYFMGRALFRGWVMAIATEEPKAALRALLQLGDDLDGQIDRAALCYDGNGIHVKHRLTGYHDFFVERLQPGERVLDIGCGCGAVAYSMAARAKALVTGIDLNADTLAMARRLFQHPHLTFVLGDALREVPAGPFDTIVISNVLEHIERRTEFLHIVQKNLSPRRWLIRVPMIDRHWLVPLRRELGLPFLSDQTHHTEYTLQSFEAEMRMADLMITHIQVNWGEIWAEAMPNAAG